jgi:hypothetical protein
MINLILVVARCGALLVETPDQPDSGGDHCSRKYDNDRFATCPQF